MLRLEDDRHAVVDKINGRRGGLGQQDTGENLGTVLSFPERPQSGEDDDFRVRCGDEVGLLDLPAGLVPGLLLVLVPLIPAPDGQQAAHAAEVAALHSPVGTFMC